MKDHAAQPIEEDFSGKVAESFFDERTHFPLVSRYRIGRRQPKQQLAMH